MPPRIFTTVDPAVLRLPNERIDGADPTKLQQQIARHGRSLVGMPAILIYRGSDGEMMISDGVTRATHAAKLCPGGPVPVELLGDLPTTFSHLPTVTEKELFDALADLRQQLPSMRFGQLVANMATVARGAVGGAVWDVSDEELLAAVRWQLEQLADCPPAEAVA